MLRANSLGLDNMRFDVNGLEAVAACLVMASGYVGVLYTLPSSIRLLPRDHPTHILARFLLICIVCALCPFLLAVFYESHERGFAFAVWLGIRPTGLTTAVFLPLLITSVLFAGTLTANGLHLMNSAKQFHTNGWWYAIKNSALFYSFHHESWQSLRNFAMGPVTEEFVFRCCMVPLLICAQFSTTQIIFGSPLAFGVAHLHHFVEHVRSGKAVVEALMIVGFQLLYTSIFGAYATFLYLRTGHFVSIVLVHVFCNLLGFPDLSFLSRTNSLHKFRLTILGAYIGGVLIFSQILVPLTEPALYDCSLWNATDPSFFVPPIPEPTLGVTLIPTTEASSVPLGTLVPPVSLVPAPQPPESEVMPPRIPSTTEEVEVL